MGDRDSTASVGRSLIRLDSVTSTMDVALALAERGAIDGTVVVAGGQTAGRGRTGREWHAAPGSSLMLSMILRPPSSIGSFGILSLLIGLAIARMVESISTTETAIKWPNDVLVHGRKVSGVLLQSRPRSLADERTIIAGIGINVGSVPESLECTAISLNQLTSHPLDVDAVYRALIPFLDEIYRDFLDGRLAAHVGELNGRVAHRNERVRIADGDRTYVGIVEGIGTTGELLLRMDDGSVVRIVAGELSRGPIPDLG